MAILAAGMAEPRASADRQRAEPVVATSAVARVAAPDRTFDSFVFAPSEQIALRVSNRFRQRPQSSTAITGAARPRRLAFRYDATAPPRSL